MPIALLSTLQPFAISLAIGLLIGIERERSHPPGYQALGLRTFVLLSLLGTMAARFKEPWLAASITLFVATAVVAGYFRSSRRQGKAPDIGITTEIAAMVTYLLGYIALKEPFIALLLGVVVLVILMARSHLHKFSRTQLRPEELQATAIILVLAVGILPFLPDKTIDPWHLFNPLRFGTLVLIIILMQFAAYAAIRIFGDTKGILLSGFLAGFVSSTAATATLAQRAKKNTSPFFPTAVAVILAIVAMFIEFTVIVFVAAPALLYKIFLPVVIPVVLMVLLALATAKYFKSENKLPVPKNPLALTTAIKVALFLALMLVIVTLSQRFLDEFGARIIIFLAGSMEVHGVILAVATLFQQGKITASQATVNIGIAIFGSFASKYIITWVIIQNNYAIICSLLLTLMLAIFAATLGLVTVFSYQIPAN